MGVCVCVCVGVWVCVCVCVRACVCVCACVRVRARLSKREQMVKRKWSKQVIKSKRSKTSGQKQMVK